MSLLRSHAGWKARHFKGMTLEEIKEKFDPVWKQMKDFIPIGSKEESERFKRKGIRFKQDSAKKLKTSEEVLEEKLKEVMELIPVKELLFDFSSSAKLFSSSAKFFSSGITLTQQWQLVFIGSGKLLYQWELFTSSGNALCILFPTILP
uniref:Uncharacterized protein n=1 Tax=Tanacetum cinerariifolium TaxID=118510 RepID=A0A6L2M2E5_TANCI|nr:hypothetical protein [Tanacetum cinerariifolium]